MRKRIAALLLALVLTASAAAFAQDAGVPDTLLVTVNGVEIRENNEELQLFYETLLNETADPDSEEAQRIARMDAMAEVIQYAVVDQKIAEAIPEEEAQKLREEARASWAEEISAILADSYEITDASTEEERTAALADLLAYLEAYYGITEETYVESFVSGSFTDQVMARLREEDPSLTAGEEDILQALNEFVAEEREEVASYAMYLKLAEEDPAKADALTDEELGELLREMSDEEIYALSNDVAAYESVKTYYSGYGISFHYIPDGYKGITHILLPADEKLLNAWTDLTARSGEDGEGGEPVTAEMVEAARRAVLEDRKDQIDEIMDRLAKGEDFEALIAEYGTDPAMEDADLLKEGYPIHPDSISYDADFTAAAAALEKIGDHSDPVVSRNGIHILHYLRDIPGGALALSDEEAGQIILDIEDQNMNLAISNLVDQWTAEAEIVWTAEGEAWKEDPAFRDAYADQVYDPEGVE